MKKVACWHLLGPWYLRDLQNNAAMYLEQLKARVEKACKILTHWHGCTEQARRVWSEYQGFVSVVHKEGWGGWIVWQLRLQDLLAMLQLFGL